LLLLLSCLCMCTCMWSLVLIVETMCIHVYPCVLSMRIVYACVYACVCAQGACINKSLLTLGTIISKLSASGAEKGHLPYRDSKLTRLLQPSLSGNALVGIVCTIGPGKVLLLLHGILLFLFLILGMSVLVVGCCM